MQKKILLLGGSYGQLPAIAEAKKRGLYTILCDYLPDNPGRAMVDEYYEVSTTDKHAVLDIARNHTVDAVLAYASDPAAITQAYVSNKLGLKGNPEQSVFMLSNKDAFRTFQKENNFRTPAFQIFTREELFGLNESDLDFPVVVKPVDSSDTKGVFKVDTLNNLKEKAKLALSYSRAEKIIVEEYIDGENNRVHGDAFFCDGEMVFSMLGDQIFHSDVSPLKPSATFFPSRLPESVISVVKEDVEAIVKLSGYQNGPVNVEARVDKKGNVYVMEIGPRSGGSLTPQAINYSCGFDMLKSTFDLLLNSPFEIKYHQSVPTLYYSLHTNKTGVFSEFRLSEELEPFVKEIHLYVEPGDHVEPYSSPGSTIGVIIISFPDLSVAEMQLDTLYDNIQASVRLNGEAAEIG